MWIHHNLVAPNGAVDQRRQDNTWNYVALLFAKSTLIKPFAVDLKLKTLYIWIPFEVSALVGAVLK